MGVEVKFIIEGSTTNPEPAKVMKALERSVRYGLGPGWTVSMVEQEAPTPVEEEAVPMCESHGIHPVKKEGFATRWARRF